MKKPKKFRKLRTKKIGLLMYDARRSTNIDDLVCASRMGVTPTIYEAYEAGELSPSLPELESFAHLLNLPMEHFWGQESLSESTINQPSYSGEKLRQLRDRIIGTRLRLAREQTELTPDQLAETTGISAYHISQAEDGVFSLPLPDLELLSKALDIPISELFDSHGPIGNWRTRQQRSEKFLELPTELQEFICQPVNQPYLDLAKQLSEMPTDRLRAIGEGFLEITL